MTSLSTGLALSAASGLIFVALVVFTVRRYYIAVDPDEFVVHYRNGRMHTVGRGRSFLCLPFDTYLKVPGTLRDISFCADQVTIEKQGLRVQGFLAYKIEDFEKAYQALDFKSKMVKLLPSCEDNAVKTKYDDKNSMKIVALDPDDPLAKTDMVLRQLAESVVRHEVSNKTLEQMLTEREKVREHMKLQLSELVAEWGLSIDTIEFTEVWIRSKEVFSNLQAHFRNEIKQRAEVSTFETHQAVAQKRLETERAVSEMEAEAERVRRVALAREQLAASEVEIESRRKAQEKTIVSDAAVREQERESGQRAAMREAELALERNLIAAQNSLKSQEQEHVVNMDQKERLEALRVREIETSRHVGELEAKARIEQAELDLQRAEVGLRISAQEEEARGKLLVIAEESRAAARRVETLAEVGRLVELAEAHRKEADEQALGLRSIGEAQALVTERHVNAENQINARHIQRLLVAELGKMAQSMKVNDVNWINISGNGEDSPLGIVPRNVLQLLSVFKGMGIGLDDVLGPIAAAATGAGQAAGAAPAAEPPVTEA